MFPIHVKGICQCMAGRGMLGVPWPREATTLRLW